MRLIADQSKGGWLVLKDTASPPLPLCKVFMLLAHRKDKRHSTFCREFALNPMLMNNVLMFAEGMFLAQYQFVLTKTATGVKNNTAN